MRADELDCLKANVPSKETNPTDVELQEGFARERGCMAGRGWEPSN